MKSVFLFCKVVKARNPDTSFASVSNFFFLSSLEKVNTLVLIEDYSGHSSTAVLLLGTAVGQ